MNTKIELRHFAVMLLFTAIIACSVTGCAGTSADLLAYDNIEAGATEAKKGLVASNEALVSAYAKQEAAYLTALEKDIENIALSKDETQESAKVLAKTVVDALRKNLVEKAKEEQNRATLFNVTMDNLNYVIEVCQQGKDFSIYRSNVSAQWKAYLNAQGRAKLGKVGE